MKGIRFSERGPVRLGGKPRNVNGVFKMARGRLKKTKNNEKETPLAKAVRRDDSGTGVLADDLKAYKLLFDNISDLAYICDASGSVLFVNRVAEKFTNRKPEDIIGKPFAPFFDEENLEKAMDAYRRTLQGQSPNYELTIKDTGLVCEYNNITLRDSDGTVIGVVGVARDITERRQRENKLWEDIMHLQFLSEAIQDVVFFKDSMSRYRAVNQAFLKVVGLERKEVIGRTDSEIHGTPVAEGFQETDDIVRKTGKPHRCEQIVPTVDGERYFDTIKGPILDGTGAVVGIVGVSRDTTERRDKEEELKKVRDDLASSVEEQTAYLMESNKRLVREIAERHQAEEKLREQMRFLQLLMDSIPNPVFYKDANGRYQGCNRAFEEALGIKNKDLVGKTDHDIVPVELADRHHEVESSLFKNPGKRVYEHPVKYSDGSIHDVAFNKATYRQKGEVAGLVGVMLDITETKRMAGELRLEHARLASIMEAMEDGLYISNRDYDIEYVNPVFEKEFGPVLSRKCYEYFHGLGRPCPWCKNDEVFAGKTVHWESYFEKSAKTYDLLSLPFENPDGSISKLEIRHDVTDYKKALKDREALQGQLVHSQKMEAVGTLAGGIAHDFNNIISVIKNLSSLAVTKVDETDPLRRYLEPIGEIADRAMNLVHQLLIFSEKKAMSSTTLNVNDVIKELLGMLKHLICEDIYLETEFDYNLWDVRADNVRIEQVITNLVINSSEAMPQGGKIVLKTENATVLRKGCGKKPAAVPGNFVCITVEDTGIGMKEKTMEHIFEPFFTTKARGTGMGLSVVYGIVNGYNGWIDVSSEPGLGSVFKVYLSASEDAGAGGPDQRRPAVPAHGGGKRVLLVEDDKWVRKSTAMVLSENGYSVFEASNAESAIGLFYREKGRFDLVISDVVMPGRSGLQMIGPLLDINPGIPILLCSGHLDDKAQISEIIRRGLAYIQKPYEINDLLIAVEETIQRKDGT